MACLGSWDKKHSIKFPQQHYRLHSTKDANLEQAAAPGEGALRYGLGRPQQQLEANGTVAHSGEPSVQQALALVDGHLYEIGAMVERFKHG